MVFGDRSEIETAQRGARAARVPVTHVCVCVVGAEINPRRDATSIFRTSSGDSAPLLAPVSTHDSQHRLSPTHRHPPTDKTASTDAHSPPLPNSHGKLFGSNIRKASARTFPLTHWNGLLMLSRRLLRRRPRARDDATSGTACECLPSSSGAPRAAPVDRIKAEHNKQGVHSPSLVGDRAAASDAFQQRRPRGCHPTRFAHAQPSARSRARCFIRCTEPGQLRALPPRRC